MEGSQVHLSHSVLTSQSLPLRGTSWLLGSPLECPAFSLTPWASICPGKLSELTFPNPQGDGSLPLPHPSALSPCHIRWNTHMSVGPVSLLHGQVSEGWGVLAPRGPAQGSCLAGGQRSSSECEYASQGIRN